MQRTRAPRIARRFLVLAWVLIFGLSLGLSTASGEGTPADSGASGIATISEAQAVLTVNNQTVAQRVALPYHWDRMHPGKPGTAVFVSQFSVAGTQPGPYAIYTPKIGNAFAIWINNKLLIQDGELDAFGTDDYAKVPRLFTVPKEMLAASNTLRIEIRSDTGRRSGLAQVHVGPMQLLRDQYATDYRLRGTGTLLVTTFSLLLAGVALSIWATQRKPHSDGTVRRDPMYLYAALAELAWSLRVGDALVESPPMSWPLWAGATVTALSAWNYFMVSFCLEVMNWQSQAWARKLKAALLAVVVLSMPCAGLAIQAGMPLLLTACYLLQVLLSGTFIIYMSWHALRGQTLDRKLVASASLANLFVGAFDLVAFRLSEAFAQNTYMRYSSVLFGLALGYTLIRRFQEASRMAHMLTRDLTQRVEMKEAELKQSYAKLELLAREQEREAERTRVLRDLHDGVGSQISLAIRQIEVGTASQDEVLRTLRESMDFLKLSIDSMGIAGGDVAGLLANFRYRLEPRLTASRIKLVWDVDWIDDRPELDDRAMRHLLFIFYEAISNVLQHSGASQLAIRAKQQTDGLVIAIEDNGVGIGEQARRGGKLKTMKDRAALISAELNVSQPSGSGTCISLHFRSAAIVQRPANSAQPRPTPEDGHAGL